MQEYNHWLQQEDLDVELKQELLSIEGNESEIMERFHGNIQFGTGGLRGVLGAGISRMNIYTVRRATQGLAQAINNELQNNPSVVIAYDCRHKSRLFAEEAAKVLAANGIKAYVFDELQPTPILSFAVRHLQATAGIVVTASHNPPEYNGFKAYWSDGAQVASERADMIMAEINQVEDIFDIPLMTIEAAEEAGRLRWLTIDGEVMEAYYSKVKGIVLQPDLITEHGEDLRIIFTPLHGTTNKPIRKVLRDIGFPNVTVVKEQELPDPNFSTVAFPNPEEAAAFALALEYAKQDDADIIIGTDPDGDRVGILAKNLEGEFVVLTGNQTGAILLDYILSQRKAQGNLPTNGVLIKTIVTSELGRVIASHYGIETDDTLTGFKFIGERIEEYTKTGEKEFLFGYEESYGYLIQDFARDKDGMQAAVMAAEVAAYYKSIGKTLYQAMEEIYQKYGYFKEGLETISLKGLEGQQQIVNMMTKLREQPLRIVADLAVAEVDDYELSEKQVFMGLPEKKFTDEDLLDQNKALGVTKYRLHLPKSNVIRYTLEDGSWFCVRPSGTEPKIKFYFAVNAETSEQADGKLLELKEDVMGFFR
ncbi:phosphoglucomutase [Desulfuribacillus stibiiarsenatis]|uniref:Phosphoglucomutase n=1 Tax=Desulfuribacillus stibiiarsenatis TaxID=1390249 RepID=A0A1E5L9J0_9FIRM|nr:phospho-sugar mutase [Desulfuribacillus stibiiarsenatis]OEH86704.1 phosphoglucomutase [Desulfuribacillus stibiiarsenatis]